MPLEAGTLIPDLDANNPLGSDPKSEGDDHLRLIKRTVLGSFPAFVGTTAVPKSVSLTEDQINDAALKSATQVISGAWEFTDNVLLANDKAYQARFSSGAATPLIGMSALDRMELGSAGHHTDFFAATGANAFRYFVGGAEVSRGGTVADGGVLIADLDGFFQKAAFRNPRNVTFSTNQTAQQSWEGGVRQCTGGNPSITIDQLEAGTSWRFIVTSSVCTLLKGNVTNMRWLDGSGSLNAIATGVTVTPGSIVEVYYQSATTMYIFGNGITEI